MTGGAEPSASTTVAAVLFLAAAGFTVDETADVIGVPVAEVAAARFASPLPPADDPLPDEEPTAPIAPTAPAGWPPPADESTVWSTIRRYTTWPRSEEVRVRTVRLWGRSVQVNAREEVWCPDCQRFLDPEVLRRPASGHPMGVPAPRAPYFSPDPVDEVPEPPVDDFLRMVW